MKSGSWCMNPVVEKDQVDIWLDGSQVHHCPQNKHTIEECPKGTGRFHIMKCEEHHVHFNTNALAGATKHLHSKVVAGKVISGVRKRQLRQLGSRPDLEGPGAQDHDEDRLPRGDE
ncbi:hypothetical protein B0H63DRAFT_289006 [Podospora didyma]|uniref:Uncharacterized protein n=1 Tax=Podospora didyma TaxID=330526 RepID=A0AAE0K8I4_9PEZI|nr:hypothetical protein B0H63DRAFT_289006 [Podospora didyma]